MCPVKWNIFITERAGALPLDRPGQDEKTKHSLLQWFPCHFMLGDCGRGLCGVLTIRNLLPWILQKWSCGFRVYSLRLIIQMCGQCSLLFSGAVPKLFKTMGILCLQEEKFREVILKALPLAYQWTFAFKKQLPSNWRDVKICVTQCQMNSLCSPDLEPGVKQRRHKLNRG